MNGSGYIAVTLTDANGCSSLNSSFYLNDLGLPNAIVGGDTTLVTNPCRMRCSLSLVHLMP